MLTVIVPSYNHQDYIAECLGAAAQINIAGLKILVIDDGSSDQTPLVVEDFISNNRNLTIAIIKKENSGLVSSLNLALDLVDTEYLYICASDDIPVARGVEQCFHILLEDKGLGFCIGGAKNFNPQKNELSNAYSKEHEEFFRIDFSKNGGALFFNYPSPLLLQSTVFRKSALEEIGGWDPKIKLDDFPVFVKLLKLYSGELGRRFIFKPEVDVVLYRHHGSNTYKNLIGQFSMVKQAINELASDNLKIKAIGVKAVYYILVAIKRLEIKSILLILRDCGIGTVIKMPYYIALFVFLRLRK